MRQVYVLAVTAVSLVFATDANGQNLFDFLFGRPTLRAEWTNETGIFDESAAEIVAFDVSSQRVFVTDSNSNAVNVLDVQDGALIGSIDVSDLGGPNSVSVFNGLVAIAIDPGITGVQGQVLFISATTLERKETVEVGFLPDSLTFTPDGNQVVVANEGEPNDDFSIDPVGSVSIIDIRRGVPVQVREATFDQFNDQAERLVASGVRIFGPDENGTVAQNLEPEFVTISANSRTAFVSLQENNAIAVVDLRSARVLSIAALGAKDHSVTPNALDASNEDGGINIRNWPVFGLYQPDTIATTRFFGRTLVVTANEGDARDFDTFSEEERVADLELDPEAFPNAAELQLDENLGRLEVTNVNGDTDNDGDFDQLFSFGARSFSIWLVTTTGRANLIYDSGDDFEQITAAEFPEDFNSNNDENCSFDNRSDDAGPEPEALAVGNDLLQTYSFVGLERIGGIMIYEITNPFSPRFIQYTNNRDFQGDAEAGTAGDLGPEGIVFIPRSVSPFVEPAIIVANEVSGTTTLFRIRREGGILSRFLNGR